MYIERKAPRSEVLWYVDYGHTSRAGAEQMTDLAAGRDPPIARDRARGEADEHPHQEEYAHPV